MFLIVMSAPNRNLGVSTPVVRDRAGSEVYPQPQRCPWEYQDCVPILSTWDHALTFIQTNILVDADGHTRVAGLGATSIPSTTPRVEVDRFFHGAAPELIEPRRFRLTNTGATTASDVYAFGVLAFEVSREHVHVSNSQTKRDLDLCWTSSIPRQGQRRRGVFDVEGTSTG
jgi:hypothetical protein